jgi:putative membrane protein
VRALLLRWVLAVVALVITRLILHGHGVHVAVQLSAFLVVLILAFANALVKPLLFLLKLITFPLNLLTLGLLGFVLSLVMNIVVFYVVGAGWRPDYAEGLAPGFRVVGLSAAALGGLLMSVINAFLLALVPERRREHAAEA